MAIKKHICMSTTITSPMVPVTKATTEPKPTLAELFQSLPANFSPSVAPINGPIITAKGPKKLVKKMPKIIPKELPHCAFFEPPKYLVKIEGRKKSTTIMMITSSTSSISGIILQPLKLHRPLSCSIKKGIRPKGVLGIAGATVPISATINITAHMARIKILSDSGVSGIRINWLLFSGLVQRPLPFF